MVRWLAEEVPHLKSATDTANHAAQLAEYIQGRPLTEIVEVADRYKADHAHLKPATINRRLAVLRRLANLAYRRWDWLDQPIGDKIILLPERNARHTYLDLATVDALVAACDKAHTRTAIRIAVYTGLRLSEIVGLTPAHIHGDTIRLGIDTKTGQPRSVPVHPEIATEIATLPIGVGKEAIQQAFTRARAAIDRPDIHFHDLRHTFASWLVQAGVPLYTAGLLLGHASTKTTARYAHLADETLKTAVAQIAGKKAVAKSGG